MYSLDLASEMAAARLRRETATATAIRDARVVAVRSAIRPGSNDEDIEATILHFYPKLSLAKRAEVAAEVRERGSRRVDLDVSDPDADECVPLDERSQLNNAPAEG